MERSVILKNLRGKIASGLPIIGGGAGTGISAKWEQAGGIDRPWISLGIDAIRKCQRRGHGNGQ